MIKSWIHAANFVLTATEGSYSNTQHISNFHLAQLKTAMEADPANQQKADMYNNYFLLDDKFETDFTTFLSQSGMQQGSVKSLTDLLNSKNITPLLNALDSSIQTVYAKTSKGYKALFPNGHAPFSNGTQKARINAIGALSIAIGKAITADTALTPAQIIVLSDVPTNGVQNKIDDYHGQLIIAFNLKNGDKNLTHVHSAACEASRIALSVGQFANYGTLVTMYAATPQMLGGYFDLEHMRTKQQTDFTHLVKFLTAYTIVQRTLAPDAQIRIHNDGNTILRFWAANTKDGAIGTVFIEVAAGANIVINASQLGDAANNHFIRVFNPDAVQTGSFELSLL